MYPLQLELNNLCFNGENARIVLPFHPPLPLPRFTLEAIFLPEAGGEEEQRFVHIQSEDSSRALLELRSTKQGWYADTFVHFPSGERFLNDPQCLHPFGQWFSLSLVYDGKSLSQWVNGEQELSAPAATGQLGAGQISLGMRLNQISPFKGQLRQVRLSDQPLEASQLLRP